MLEQGNDLGDWSACVCHGFELRFKFKDMSGGWGWRRGRLGSDGFACAAHVGAGNEGADVRGVAELFVCVECCCVCVRA